MSEMNSPTIRFAGFTDDWEERKLGEIAIEVTRKAEEGSVAPVMMISAASGFIDQSTKYSSDNAGSSLKNYTLLIEGELAYNHGYSKLRNFGSCFDLKVAEARIPFVYHAFSMPNDNPSFFAYYLNSGMFDGELKKRVSSSARMDGLLNISYAEYMSLKISRPNIAEQQKISELISKVDRLITLHQREHDKTVNIKKALLEKMFPKAGEDKPEIRFAGFTGAWKRRKLGDLGSVVMNRRIFKEQTSESGDIPFYKIGTFGAEPDSFISRELFEEYKSKYPYPKVGDILISASGSIGKTVEYTGKDEYFQDSNIVWLQHDERLNKSFLKHFYSVVKWHGLEGSTIKRLYNKNILDTKINVPSLDEQQVVGAFFDRLSDLITLHKRELTKLQNIKKALLEKMFV